MSFFKGFKTGFQDFGHYVTNVINFFLLLLVYFIGVGLTKLFGRRKYLDTEISKKTYWKDYNLSKKKKDYYYRQF